MEGKEIRCERKGRRKTKRERSRVEKGKDKTKERMGREEEIIARGKEGR